MNGKFTLGKWSYFCLKTKLNFLNLNLNLIVCQCFFNLKERFKSETKIKFFEGEFLKGVDTE